MLKNRPDLLQRWPSKIVLSWGVRKWQTFVLVKIRFINDWLIWYICIEKFWLTIYTLKCWCCILLKPGMIGTALHFSGMWKDLQFKEGHCICRTWNLCLARCLKSGRHQMKASTWSACPPSHHADWAVEIFISLKWNKGREKRSTHLKPCPQEVRFCSPQHLTNPSSVYFSTFK